MDVVVKGHHLSVTDGFRSYVTERITRLEKLEQRAIRIEVKVSADNNKGTPTDDCRAEITLIGRGPAVRAEAQAEDKQVAFDKALDKLIAQLRKAADRKRVHRGKRTPKSVQAATADLNGVVQAEAEEESDVQVVAGMTVEGDGPLVVREKVHQSPPMTLDQALYEMELVGHDFYLFVEAESHRPSVVYRRKGYDYGVIHLETADQVEMVS
ncbi:MAG TPA: ribosome-associated translation inhibitor RaiA [Candidatus Avipropionibacterium avicola]|uniref:Ribosome hibernation promoting factor n=1 Tax=Candidatus Avipropionibacterium avicola TaxID=2840701 RepID=A0A9D1KMN4_9ACTN|nr:ribosome-associated translation inhibitor RaiA [Candidatus Avipropionibacterium avicola]